MVGADLARSFSPAARCDPEERRQVLNGSKGAACDEAMLFGFPAGTRPCYSGCGKYAYQAFAILFNLG